jgi:hypothetical protein
MDRPFAFRDEARGWHGSKPEAELTLLYKTQRIQRVEASRYKWATELTAKTSKLTKVFDVLNHVLSLRGLRG